MLSITLELYLATAILFVGLFAVGAPAALALRLGGGLGLVLSPVLGAITIEVYAWYLLDLSSIGLHAALPWLVGTAIVAAASIQWQKRSRNKSSGWSWPPVGGSLADIKALGLTSALTAAAFTLHASPLLGFGHLTSGSLGNNDLPAYAAIAKHISLHGYADSGWIVGNHLGDLARTDVSGMYSILSYATWITGRGEWELAMPVLLVATILIAQGLYLLLIRITPLRSGAAVLLATIAVNTFLFTYISWHYFISQLFAMVALPLLIYLVIVGEVDLGRRRTQLIIAAIVAHLLLVYPHMAFILPPAVLTIVTIGQGSMHGFLRRMTASARLLLVGSALGAILVATRFVVAIERLTELEGTIAGWNLPGVLPWALIGFQTSFRSTATAGVVFASLILVVESFASWQQRRKQEGAGSFPFLGIGVVVLLAQGVSYFLRGNGYEHWKWISFFQPLLTVALIFPFVAGLSEWASKTTRHLPQKASRFLIQKAPLFVLSGLLVAGISNARVATRALGQEGRSVWVDLELADLAGSHILDNLEAIDVAIGPYWDSMWAAALLGPRPVHLLQTETYFQSSPSTAGTMLVETRALTGAAWLEPTYINNRFALTPSMPDSTTSREPGGLAASVEVELYPGPDASASGTYSVTNTGEALWLGTRNGSTGEVTLGVRAFDASDPPVSLESLRFALVDWPLWVPPGETVSRTFTLPHLSDDTRLLQFVPVAELVAWFDGLGTVPVEVGLPQPNSLNGSLLAANTTAALRTNNDGTVTINYSVTNTGEAHWLGGNAGRVGETTLSVQPLDERGTLLAIDYTRIQLVPWPLSIAPGETIEGIAVLTVPSDNIRYLRFIPVVEQGSWFDDYGPAVAYVAVKPADTQRITQPDEPNSTKTQGLSAEVEIELLKDANSRLIGNYTITNTGHTNWLGTRDGSPGEVKIGVQAVDDDFRPVSIDYMRIPLGPLNIAPGDTVSGSFTLPDHLPNGTRGLRFLPIAEHVAWFDAATTTPIDVGNPQPNSTKPDLLDATTTVVLTDNGDSTFRVMYSVTNTGDAHWLGSHSGNLGETNLGVQAIGADGSVIAADYKRIPLVPWPLSIAPGETVEGTATIPPPPSGTHHFRFVPVAELVAWFDQLGSSPANVPVPPPSGSNK